MGDVQTSYLTFVCSKYSSDCDFSRVHTLHRQQVVVLYISCLCYNIFSDGFITSARDLRMLLNLDLIVNIKWIGEINTTIRTPTLQSSIVRKGVSIGSGKHIICAMV